MDKVNGASIQPDDLNLIGQDAFKGKYSAFIEVIKTFLNNISVPIEKLVNTIIKSGMILLYFQNFIKDIFEDSSLTLSIISKCLVYFIAGMLLYRIVSISFFPRPYSTFFRFYMFSLAYGIIWSLIGLLAFKELNIPLILCNLTVRNLLKHSCMIFIFISISLSLFVAISLIIMFLPAFVLIASILLCSFALIAGMYFKIKPSSFNITCISIPVLIIVVIISIFARNSKVYMTRLRRSIVLVYNNLIGLVFFLIISSSIYFIQLYSLNIIWMNAPYRSISYFFLIFMFAWVYFSTSYLNNVFISSLLYQRYVKGENASILFDYSIFKKAVLRSLEASNYIHYCAMLPAFFQTVISLLNSLNYVTKESKIGLIRFSSKIIYVFIWMLGTISFLIDFHNSSAFTSVGFNGIRKYLSTLDNNVIVDDDDSTDQNELVPESSYVYCSTKSFGSIISTDKLLYFSWEFLPYVSLIISSLVNYLVVITSFKEILYYFFISYSILSGLISSVLIAYQVQTSKKIRA